MLELEEKDYYSVEPIRKIVTKKEFQKFINNYPRELQTDVCGISEPPLLTMNDFELADRWPYSIIASHYIYDDDPKSYYYTPEEERIYSIMSNYNEVFNSRSGINTTEYEKLHQSNNPMFQKGIEKVKIYNESKIN